LLLFLSFFFLFISTLSSSLYYNCPRVHSSFGLFPIVILNHSDVSSDPKRDLEVSFLISPNHSLALCHSHLVVVHSHVKNVLERRRLRRTFESVSLSFRLLFVLGMESVESVEDLREERRMFDDLLVIDVIEDYHNITYKAQSWIRYLDEECRDVRWIVKMDDDVEVDPPLLSSLLRSHRHYSRVLMGRVYLNNRVMRNRHSKWYLSPSEFSSSSLGEYLQGMSYVMSGDLLPSLRENIDRVQYLWMDDWYVTHALLNGTSASLVDISLHIGSANSREEVEGLRRRGHSLIFMHLRPKEDFPLSERNRIWNEMKKSCD
ncbi:hypothetical protein PMAYCL1PPCAC_02355, partial [Pristionchus mayeri]